MIHNLKKKDAVSFTCPFMNRSGSEKQYCHASECKIWNIEYEDCPFKIVSDKIIEFLDVEKLVNLVMKKIVNDFSKNKEIGKIMRDRK